MTGIMHSLVLKIILGLCLGVSLVHGAEKTANSTSTKSTTTTTAVPPDLSGESTNIQRAIYLAPGESRSSYSSNGNGYGHQGPAYERNEYDDRATDYQQSPRANEDYYKGGDSNYHQNQQQASYGNAYEEQNYGNQDKGYEGNSGNGASYQYEDNSGNAQNSYQSQADNKGESYQTSKEDGYGGDRPQYLQYAYEVSSKPQQSSYASADNNGKSGYASGETEAYSPKEPEYYPSPKPTRYVQGNYQDDGYTSSGTKADSYFPEVPKQAGYASKTEEEPSYLKNPSSESSYSKQAGYSPSSSESGGFLPMLPKSGHFHEEDGSKVAFFIKHLGHQTAENNYGTKERKGYLLVPLVPDQMEIKLKQLKSENLGSEYTPAYQEDDKSSYQQSPVPDKGEYVQQQAPVAKYPVNTKAAVSYGSDNKYPVEVKAAVPYNSGNEYPVQTKVVVPYNDGNKYTVNTKAAVPYNSGNKYAVDSEVVVPYDGHKYSVDTKAEVPYDEGNKYAVEVKGAVPYDEGNKYAVGAKVIIPYDEGHKYTVGAKAAVPYDEGNKYTVDEKVVVPYDTGNKYPEDAKLILPYTGGNKYSVDTKVEVPYSTGYKYPVDAKVVVPYDAGNKYSVDTKIAVPYSADYKYPENTKVTLPYTTDYKYSVDTKVSVPYGSAYGNDHVSVKPQSKVVVSQGGYGVLRPVLKHSAYVDTQYQSPRVHSYSTAGISEKGPAPYVPKVAVNYGTGKEVTYSKPSLAYGGRQAVIPSYTGGIKYEPVSLYGKAPDYISPYDITSSHKSAPIKASRYYPSSYGVLPRIVDTPGHSHIPSLTANVKKSNYGTSSLYSSNYRNYGSRLASRHASPKLETSLKSGKQITILLEKPSAAVSLRPSSYSSRGRVSAKALVEDFGLHGYESLLGQPKGGVSSLYYDLHAFPSNHRYTRTRVGQLNTARGPNFIYRTASGTRSSVSFRRVVREYCSLTTDEETKVGLEDLLYLRLAGR